MTRVDTYFEYYQDAYQNVNDPYPVIVIHGPFEIENSELSHRIIDDLKNKLSIPDENVKTFNHTLSNLEEIKQCQNGILYLDHINNIDFISHYQKNNAIIINSIKPIPIKKAISLWVSNKNPQYLFQVFKELLDTQQEAIDNDALRWLQRYFEIYSLQMDDEIDCQDVEDLFQKMVIHRIDKGTKQLSMKDIPQVLIKFVDDFLDKEMHKENILDDVLNQVQTLVRSQPIADYMNDFLFRYRIEQQMKEKHLSRSYDTNTIVLIVGNPGTGKTLVSQLFAKLYYACDIINSDKVILNDSNEEDALLEKAYQLNRLFVIEDFKPTQIEKLVDYHQKGLKILLNLTQEQYKQLETIDNAFVRKSKLFYLSDFTPNELYQLFEQICDQNQLILSNEAKASIKTILVLAYKEGKTQKGNIYFVRRLFEMINLKRYQRQSDPFYEILLEDVLLAIEENKE